MGVRSGVWKHAVSDLHSIDGGGGSPAVTPAVEANPLFDQIAHAAAVGLMAHSDVVHAQVGIGGTDQRPEAQITCVLAPSGDLARVADLIDSSLLGQMEILLGREFTAVDVRIQHPARRLAA